MALKNSAFMEKFVNILLNVLIVLFSIILLISIYSGFQVKILGNRYANFFGYSVFEVLTDSMADTISAGDWIIVKLTQKVKINDVITYDLKGEFVTHRVIQIYDGTYITRGDANNGKDDPVDQSQIIGKMTKVLAGFGILRKTLFNPAVLIMLIITLVLFNSAVKKGRSENIFITVWEIIKSIAEEIVKIITKNENKNKNVEIKENIGPKLYSFDEAMSIIEDTPRKMGVQINEVKIPGIENGKEEDESLFFRKKLEEIKQVPLEPIITTLQEEPMQIDNISPIEDVVEESVVSLSDNEESISVVEEFNQSIQQTDINVESTEEIIEETEEEVYTEDDMDKTQFYRVIPVDMSELNETRLEIAQNEMRDQQAEELKREPEVVEEIVEEEENDGLTNIDLSLIKNHKKSKNIIEAIINAKKEELNGVISAFLETDRMQTNEASIKNEFITAYIHGRYYNYFDEIDITGKNIVTRLSRVIKILATSLVESYTGTDNKYYNKVVFYTNIFKVIANIDYAKDNIGEAKLRRIYYKEEIQKVYKDWDSKKCEAVISEILRIQKSYNGICKYFLNKIDTNTFYLEYDRTAIKEHFVVELKHNLNFSKVYSDYIIDKTYSEGMIAEDKLEVLFTLLSKQIVEDMINADFEKKYYVYISSSLYQKEKKLMKLLKMIEDEYAKAHIIILITFDDLKNNKQCTKKVKKAGFRFAVVFNNDRQLLIKDRGVLYLTDTIFVNKKDEKIDEIMDYIPDDIVSNVINDDVLKKIEYIEVDSE